MKQLRQRLISGFVFSLAFVFATMGLAYSDDFDLAKLVVSSNPSETIAGLVWSSTDIHILNVNEAHPLVTIEGKYDKDGYFLFHDGRMVEVDPSTKKFIVVLRLTGKSTPMDFTEVSPDAVSTPEKAIVYWSSYGEAPPARPSEAPVSTTSQTVAESVPIKDLGPNTFGVSLGLTSIAYTESAATPENEFAMSVEARANHRLDSQWSVDGDLFYTALPLSSSRSDNLTFLTGRLAAIYDLPVLGSGGGGPWRLKIAGGFYYETTFTNVTVALKQIGYGNFLGPQISPEIHYQVNARDSASLAVAETPNLNNEFLPDFSSNVVSLKLAWDRRLTSGQIISADLRFSESIVTVATAVLPINHAATLISLMGSFTF